MNLRADMRGFASKAFQPSERNGAMVILNRSFERNKYAPLERVLLGYGCVSKSFDMLCELTCGVWRSICRV